MMNKLNLGFKPLDEYENDYMLYYYNDPYKVCNDIYVSDKV